VGALPLLRCLDLSDEFGLSKSPLHRGELLDNPRPQRVERSV